MWVEYFGGSTFPVVIAVTAGDVVVDRQLVGIIVDAFVLQGDDMAVSDARDFLEPEAPIDGD